MHNRVVTCAMTLQTKRNKIIQKYEVLKRGVQESIKQIPILIEDILTVTQTREILEYQLH